jgi:hypothetical protein
MIIIYWFSSYLFYYFNEKTFPTFFSLLYELCVSSAFAQTQNSPALTDTIEKKHFPYAAACEDVKAQSQILLNLQHQLNQNPKQHAQIT